MKVNAAHVAFNRGEVCKEGLGRIDVEKMALAAACQVNWLPWSIGAMQLRPGLQWIGETRNDAKCKLIKFVKAKGDTAIVELTDSVARFRVDEALVTRVAVGTAVAAGDMSTPPTTVSLSLSTNSVTSWAGVTGRQVIKGSDLVAANSLQVTIRAKPLVVFGFQKMFIAKKASTQSFASTPVPITFAGSPNGTISPQANGGTMTSDPIAIAIDGVSDYVISWYAIIANSGTSDLNTKSGWQAYFKTGDSAATVAVTGYSSYANAVALIDSITLYPTNSANWDYTGTTSGCTATVVGGLMTLTATALGGLAQAKQAITVASGDQNKRHALRFTVQQGPVTVRIGSADGLDDWLGQTSIDTGTHALAFTPTLGTAYLQIESTDNWPKVLTSVQVDAAGVLELPTPWVENKLFSVRADQSADVIFCACVGVRQRKIERRDVDSWSIVEYRSVNGPFATAPGRANTNLTPSATCGAITLKSSRPYFQPGHVGTLFRLFSPGQTLGQTVGAADAWTPAVRIQGVGAQRNFNIVLNGTYTGTVTVQQSFDGPDEGWVDVGGATGSKVGAGAVSATLAQNTGGTRLDNVIVWYRVGFKSADYTSGSVVVTSNFNGGGAYGILRITAVLDNLTALASVISALASTAATPDWVEQEWSDIAGYPTAVVFNEGRLGWFGTSTWVSEADDFTSFADIDSDGTSKGDSGAINEEFGSGPVDVIPWALSLQRLIIGREMSIGSARSSALDSPLTPTDISIKDCSTQGAARLPAVKIGSDGIYVQGSGRKIYAVSWVSQKFDYGTTNLTRLNLDIGKPGFTTLDVQHQPDVYVRMPRGDGMEAVLLYEPDEDLACFTRNMTLGVIEDSVVLPTATGIEDAVYCVVKRLVNGVTRRFVEKYATRDACIGGLVNQLADSHVVYSGAPSRTISLPHLPNTEVILWGDGHDLGTVTTDAGGLATAPGIASYSNLVGGLGGKLFDVSAAGDDDELASITVGSAYEGMPAVLFADGHPAGSVNVTAGVLTLPDNRTANTIVACLGFVAPFMSAKLAYGAQAGTALNQKKKFDHLGIVAYDMLAGALQYGQRFDKLHDMPLIFDGVPVDTAKVFSEFDEPTIPLSGSWDTDARLCLLAAAPKPVKLGGVVMSLQTVEKIGGG